MAGDGTARLEDREIRDLKSFDEHTRDERAVAGLLFYKELDCLVDLAHLVSLDFFDRPQMYKDVSEDLAKDLAAFSARYGYDERFLSRDQRRAIFGGVFGATGVVGGEAAPGPPPQADSFAGLRDQLLAAAAAFAERVFDTGADMLRAVVRVVHVYLKDYLEDVSGASVRWSRDVGFPKVTESTSYRILRDPQIAARFGVDEPPLPEWPYRADANGSKLVEQISGTPMRVPAESISRGLFNDKQQIALRGAEALAAVMDYDSNPDPNLVDLLTRKCYTWYAARGRVLRLSVDGSAPLPVAAAGPTGAMSLAVTSPARAPLVAGGGNRRLYDAALSTLPAVMS